MLKRVDVCSSREEMLFFWIGGVFGRGERWSCVFIVFGVVVWCGVAVSCRQVQYTVRYGYDTAQNMDMLCHAMQCNSVQRSVVYHNKHISLQICRPLNVYARLLLFYTLTICLILSSPTPYCNPTRASIPSQVETDRDRRSISILSC